MLYIVTKWLFVLSSRSLARRFKTYASDNKNKKFQRRAYELDDYLIKMFEMVKESAENHVLNSREIDDVDSGYMRKLNENVRLHTQQYSGYMGRMDDSIPFIPVAVGEVFLDMDDELIITPADFREAQEKVNELGDKTDNGDNRQE